MRLRFGLAVGGEGILDHLVLENENVLVADVPGLVRGRVLSSAAFTVRPRPAFPPGKTKRRRNFEADSAKLGDKYGGRSREP
jgi:hypothetical protein